VEGKIAILGDADFVMPFSALGLDTYPVTQGTEQLTETTAEIVEGKYAMVVVAENIAPVVEDAFSAQVNAPTPCIVVVPFTTESEGFATRSLGEALKIATGIDILQNT
jgi:V/A-type H+-transporting ATPase subunit F